MAHIINFLKHKATSKQRDIRLPEDGFVAKALALAGDEASAQELIEAHKWLSLAALRGSRLARRHRLSVSHRLSGEQIADAQAQVADYLAARL